MNKKASFFLAILLVLILGTDLSARVPKTKPANSTHPVSIQVLDGLIQQLSKDDKNLTQCLNDIRNDRPSKIFSARRINLNNDSMPDFILEAISSPENCFLCGARRCNQWVFFGIPQGFSLVLTIEGADTVSVLKTSTKGFYDLSIVYPAGNTYPATEEINKFDGNHYQKTNQPVENKKKLPQVI